MMQRPMVWKSLLYGGGMGLAVLLLVGIPSGVIPNQFFVRPLDARPTDYLFLGIITAMAVALGATYGVPTVCRLRMRKHLAAGCCFSSVLAVRSATKWCLP